MFFPHDEVIVSAVYYVLYLGWFKDQMNEYWVEQKKTLQSSVTHVPSGLMGCASALGTIHKGRQQNFEFLDPLPPCLHFGQIHST